MHFSNIHIKIVSRIVLTIFLVFVFSLQNLSAQNKEVVAKNGDGIYKMLKRNGLDPAKYTEAFVELNKTRLGKNNTLFTGVKYKLPNTENKTTQQPVVNEIQVLTEAEAIAKTEAEAETEPASVSAAAPKVVEPAVKAKSNTINFKIFGQKYSNIEIKSNELKGAVYYLKSGHGGPDPGAIGKYQNHQVCEDEYAYDVTLRLAKNLIERGATVYMITIDKNDGIRDDSFLRADKDEVCYPNLTIPLNQVKRLHQRVESINKLYNKNGNAFQRLIIIHVDSRSKAENIDIFFYHDSKSNTGKKTATTLQQTFHKKYNEHQPGRGYQGTVSARNLYVLKNSYPVGVYIELANINHQRDIQRLIIPDNRQAVANWLAQGLVADFKTNK